jgi:hypothetical protein
VNPEGGTITVGSSGAATVTFVKPQISGGDYTGIDTKDGFFIVRDVPILSSVKKGEKRAPEDIGSDWLSKTTLFHKESYEGGKIAFPIHIGHTDDLGLTHPEFAGFFKPTSVRTFKVNGEDKPTIFADLKLKAAAFSRMKAGELPYVSPEIRTWGKNKISSVALLDSDSPHNEYPLMTIDKVVEDPTAKFAADLPPTASVARFNDKDVVRFMDDPFEPVKDDKGAKEHGATKCCAHCEDTRGMVTKMAAAYGIGGKMSDKIEAGKPNAAPVEQPSSPPAAPAAAPMGVRMAEDLSPAMAARFAAQEEAFAALQKRFDLRDKQETAAKLAEGALAELKGYQVTDATKGYIVKFASEGADKLKEFIAAVKPSLVKDGTGTLRDAEMASIRPDDPAIKKFAEQGPEKLEKAARFAGEWNEISKSFKGFSVSREQFVKQRMAEMDAESNGGS